MRTIKMLICVIALVFMSCETDNNADSLNLEFDTTFKQLTNNKIGNEKDGQFTLNVSNNIVLKTFNEFAMKYDLNVKSQSFKVVTIDDKKYIRFYGEKGNVATIAISKDKNNQYRTGSTVCVTEDCANGGGCVPNGLYCTKCLPDGAGWPKGDCKRTTTGISDI